MRPLARMREGGPPFLRCSSRSLGPSSSIRTPPPQLCTFLEELPAPWCSRDFTAFARNAAMFEVPGFVDCNPLTNDTRNFGSEMILASFHEALFVHHCPYAIAQNLSGIVATETSELSRLFQPHISIPSYGVRTSQTSTSRAPSPPPPWKQTQTCQCSAKQP